MKLISGTIRPVIVACVFFACGCQPASTQSTTRPIAPTDLGASTAPMDVDFRFETLAERPGYGVPIDDGGDILFALACGGWQIEGSTSLRSFLVFGRHRVLITDMRTNPAIVAAFAQFQAVKAGVYLSDQIFIHETAERLPAAVKGALATIRDKPDVDLLLEIARRIAAGEQIILKGRTRAHLVVVALRANISTRLEFRDLNRSVSE